MKGSNQEHAEGGSTGWHREKQHSGRVMMGRPALWAAEVLDIPEQWYRHKEQSPQPDMLFAPTPAALLDAG